jgi:single stranded DNA-binding protein
MEKIILMGRLCKDFETKFSTTGLEITSNTIAVDKKVKGEKKTAFYKVTFFGKQGLAVSKYTGKGKLIYIEGIPESKCWINKKTNEPQSNIEVIVNFHQIIEWNKKEEHEEPSEKEAYSDSETYTESKVNNAINQDEVPF